MQKIWKAWINAVWTVWIATLPNKTNWEEAVSRCLLGFVGLVGSLFNLQETSPALKKKTSMYRNTGLLNDLNSVRFQVTNVSQQLPSLVIPYGM